MQEGVVCLVKAQQDLVLDAVYCDGGQKEMSSEPLYVDVLHLAQRYGLASEESSPSADVHLLEFVEA